MKRIGIITGAMVALCFALAIGRAGCQEAQAIDADLTYSGTGACGGGQFVTALNADAAPTCAAAGGGLTKFTEAESTSAPNATVYVDSLTAAAASTNADVAFVAKGTGATLAQVPDSATSGGNKRGTYATDWQKSRASAVRVASGNYAAIGGGHNNEASGAYSTVTGGDTNRATNTYTTVGGGTSNVASGTSSTVYGGNSNTASGANSVIGGGYGNVADFYYGTIPGGRYASTRGRWGRFSFASGQFATVGDAQMGIHVTSYSTTNAAATRLTAFGSMDALVVNVLPNAHAYMVRAEVVARQNTTGDAKMWLITAGVKRGASAATTALVGAATVTVIGADAGAAAWTATLVADTTRGSIEIEVVGEAGKTIRWVGTMYTTEVGG